MKVIDAIRLSEDPSYLIKYDVQFLGAYIKK
jgi:hypothetical protein